jgi:RNA polymerase sigma-70 factor, ECF subfamily
VVVRACARSPRSLTIFLFRYAQSERLRLASYVDRFNARDFDAIRAMLADEVQLELVNKARRRGRTELENYFTNYSRIDDWHFVAGCVDQRPAVLVRDPSGQTIYFVLLQWAGDQLVNIRDFRHADYATEGAELLVMDQAAGMTA